MVDPLCKIGGNAAYRPERAHLDHGHIYGTTNGKAMTQAHAFKAAELALLAQSAARCFA